MSAYKQWCDEHWNPIRQDRSINGIVASMELIQALVNDESFIRHCGGGPGKKAKTDRMNAEMEKLGPLCCYFEKADPGYMLRLYEKCRKEGAG